jgi:hypothetical protein
MVRITERDKKIFYILFKLRYLNAKQLSFYLDCNEQAIYDRVSKLKREGYIESNFIEQINHRVYTNSFKVRCTQEINSYRKKVKINRTTLRHHLRINDVYLHLVKKLNFAEGDIFSERELYIKKVCIKGNKKVPDLVIRKTKGNKDRYIAIEVEMTQKNDDTLKEVFRNFRRNTTFYGISYFCRTEGIKKKVNKISKKLGYDYILAMTLEEFYNGEDFLGF